LQVEEELDREVQAYFEILVPSRAPYGTGSVA
jgi:hypothetical protein